jgi:hypothetical protein
MEFGKAVAGTRVGPRVAVGLALVATLTLAGGARAWSVATDGHRRAHQSEARQAYLHRQLANKDAVLESQRRIYMERFRRLEAQIRERERDIAVLRARLVDRDHGKEGTPWPATSSR